MPQLLVSDKPAKCLFESDFGWLADHQMEKDKRWWNTWVKKP